MREVITDNLELWSSALITKSTAGRGNNGKLEAYGIQKLRELILELAVRGKLVPQDPNDEPASVLLDRTIAEKEKLIKKNIIRDTKSPLLPTDPPAHELPDGWVWTNLYSMGEISPRNDIEDALEASFVPMQLISEFYGIPVTHEIRPWGEIKSGFTHFKEDDVVLAKITPCFQNGKSAVMRDLTNGVGAGTTELHVYRAINACTVPEYVLIYLKSPGFIIEGIPKMTGTAGQKRITRDYFAGNHFPLPPSAEQHRIVAKVDELMAVCEQLEQQQTRSIEAHQILVTTMLGTLTRVESQQQMNEAWTRLANDFETLFTTEHSIDQLEQTLLQLAVMGKLVPQDPSDAPSREFIKQKPMVKDKDTPFNIPNSWIWARVDEFSQTRLGKMLDKAKNKGKLCRYLRNINVRWFDFDLSDVKEMRFEDSELEEFALRRGDVLICEGGYPGRAAVWDEREVNIYFQKAIHRVRLQNWINPYYFVNVLRESADSGRLNTYFTGAGIQHFTGKGLNSFLVPLPPPLEQQRIVTKVDEVMAMCDALKARLSDAKAIQLFLADTIVAHAVA